MKKEEIREKIESAVKLNKSVGPWNRFLGGVAYLGVFCLLPKILKVKNEFVRFHTKQGIVLFFAEIIFFLISIIPFIGPIIGFLGLAACGVFSLIGFARTLMGQKWEIPFIRKFTDRVKL